MHTCLSCSSFELVLQGKLVGSDARANIILADSVEREFSEDEGVEMVPLGLYLIKGDNVLV
jgi:U6 snRNA-associated Sm-like protein LSm8